MNPAYVHLALNHIPILTTLIGTLFLLFAMVRRSRDVKNASLMLLVLAALSTIPVFLTGEPAEEIVEEFPGVSHDSIHEHEEAGEKAMIASEVLGVLALAGLLWPRFKGEPPRGLNGITAVAAIVTVAMMFWTATLGGKIRHTEAYAPVAAQPEKH